MVVFLGVDRRQDPGELLTPGSSSEDFFDLCERLFRTRGFLILGGSEMGGKREERKKENKDVNRKTWSTVPSALFWKTRMARYHHRAIEI